MDDMRDFFSGITDTSLWPARWHCGEWSSFHGWLYILSDLAIWGAYFSIPIAMLWFIVKRKEDIPFVKVFWLFVAFILACGTTHLADAVMFWVPAYRLGALVLAATAVISWSAVVSLIRVIPEAVKLRSPAQYEEIISERTLELRMSNHNLVKLNNDLDNFVYAASHDLKSPLNNFQGLLALLKKSVTLNDDSKEILDRMTYSCAQMQKTIDGISEAIKIDKSPLDDVDSVSLQTLVDEVLRENETLVRAARPAITLDLEVNNITYSRTGLKSTLYNLITNACKYRDEHRPLEIMIRTYKVQGRVYLEVKDNGLGINLKIHGKKIFGLFKRFHDHVEGSGLGLYMIKRMLEDRGGTIDVNSEPSRGTTFTVTFATYE